MAGIIALAFRQNCEKLTCPGLASDMPPGISSDARLLVTSSEVTRISPCLPAGRFQPVRIPASLQEAKLKTS